MKGRALISWACRDYERKGKRLSVYRTIATLLLTFGVGLVRAADIPRAFPEAVGWAASTPGGRGGRLIRVTSLEADGPGSFAEAVRAKGARMVVFEVGGVIDLHGKTITVSEPYLTVAGQTAPSPGMTFIRGGLRIRAHDVVLRHLRVRPGEAGHAKKSGWEVDAIATSGADAYNIIVDHCSCTWATDENLSAGGSRFEGDDIEQWRLNTSRNITFSHCIIAEGLNNSTHAKGKHSKGTLVHDNCTNIAIVGNLYAHNHERNPLFKGGATGVVVNNFIYDPNQAVIHYGLSPKEWGKRPHGIGRMAIVGNVLEYGPTTRANVTLFHHKAGGPSEVFLADNLAFDHVGEPINVLHVESKAKPGEFRRVTEEPLWPAGLKALPAEDVKRHVLENAGARPWDRDEVDRRIVRQARQGVGRVIDSEQQVGGYPHPAPAQAPFDPQQWNLDDMTRNAAWPSKVRVVIETDAPGGDPDDEGSLVRFFLYLNEWDVEGLIGTRAAIHSRLKVSGEDRILQYIDGYETAYRNLTVHCADYPTPQDLRRVTKQCYEGRQGRDHVIAVVDRDDLREIWYLNWGTNEEDDKPTALREALDYVKKTRSVTEYERFAGKIRYVEVYKDNNLGPHRQALAFYMDTFYPDMDGGRWYHRWRPLTQRAGGFDVERDIKNDHGPLCANYTIQKEGDTPTFMHLIPNGLNVPERPQWGGWAGRYRFNDDLGLWWCDQQDTWQGTTNRDNTLRRWTTHLQNDFKARADWCVARTFAEANHTPRPHLQGDDSYSVLELDAAIAAPVSLSAAGSVDPDGDDLTYEWIHYPEPGTYEGSVTLENATGQTCTVHVPADALGKTIHIILQVSDDGAPSLTRYRRAVLKGAKVPATR
jgi:pectate lyase